MIFDFKVNIMTNNRKFQESKLLRTFVAIFPYLKCPRALLEQFSPHPEFPSVFSTLFLPYSECPTAFSELFSPKIKCLSDTFGARGLEEFFLRKNLGFESVFS